MIKRGTLNKIKTIIYLDPSSQLLRASRRKSVLLEGSNNNWMNLPFGEMQDKLDYEKISLKSLINESKYNKQTIREMENELKTFSQQAKEWGEDKRRYRNNINFNKEIVLEIKSYL